MSSSKFLRVAGVLSTLSCLLPLSALAQSASVTPVCTNCYITSVSADGKHATGMMANNYETFYWKKGATAVRLGRSTVDTLGVSGGVPAISADGSKIASTILSDDGTVATSGIWTADTGWAMIRPLPADVGVGDSQDSSVWNMSADGSTVVGLYWRYGQTDGVAHGYYTDASGAMVGLHTKGGSGRMNGVNADGSVMVGWEEADWGGWRATIWAHGKRTIVGRSDSQSIAQATNAAGNLVVGQASDDKIGFSAATLWKWDGSTWRTKRLGVLSGTDWGGMAYANALSEDGSVIGGLARLQFGPQGTGFIWTKAGGMQTAKDYFAARGYSNADYDITNVVQISANGRQFVLTEQLNKSPWTLRGVIVKLSKTGAE